MWNCARIVMKFVENYSNTTSIKGNLKPIEMYYNRWSILAHKEVYYTDNNDFHFKNQSSSTTRETIVPGK